MVSRNNFFLVYCQKDSEYRAKSQAHGSNPAVIRGQINQK